MENNLTIVSEYRVGPRKFYMCQCICGQEVSVRSDHFKSGHTRSCGCLYREHGWVGTPTYRTWQNMMNRCGNPKATQYKYYGGRGVTVCERWHDFRNFLEDMGERPNGKTIDRVEDALVYSKENCRWATHSEQIRNRRPFEYKNQWSKGREPEDGDQSKAQSQR